MRAFLLSLIPWYAFAFALCFAVVAFGGQWPDWHFLIACGLLGVGYGTRRFISDKPYKRFGP